MMRTLPVTPVLVLAACGVSALVVAACGSDDKVANDTPGSPIGDAAAAGNDGNVDPQTGDGGGGGGDGGDGGFPPPDYGLRNPIPTTDFDIALGTRPAAIPPTNAPDVVGAFRFICNANELTYDDATVFPNVPGASHLHDVSGRNMDAFLTYEKARMIGGSSCNDIAAYDNNPAEKDFALNRTPYWQPALLDGKGNVVRPDDNAFYYKREPSGSADCANKTRFPGGCAPVPFGLKQVAGNKPTDSSYKNPNAPPEFLCIWNNGSGVQNFNSDLAGAIACAKAKSGSGTPAQVELRQITPDCWDGVHTDTPDHRSHLAYQKNSGQGYFYCDAQHPVHIPFFLFTAAYTVLGTDDVSNWHLSSDEMDPTKPAGWSFHIDYGPMSWDPVTFQTIMDNCIDKLLSCAGGNMGNGTALKGADQPRYLINGNYVPSWTNPKRLVPVPPMSMSMPMGM